MTTTPCHTCAGTGSVARGDYIVGCPDCHGVGFRFPEIDHETDLPCPVLGDRDCRRCGDRTVSVTWKSGQAIARCCQCHTYVCCLPKRAIAWSLQAARRSA